METKFKFDTGLNGYKFPSSQFADYVLSPAEIQSLCFKCDNLLECIEELLEDPQYKYIINKYKKSDIIINFVDSKDWLIGEIKKSIKNLNNISIVLFFYI
jgi:hypothetical protein